MSVQPKPAEAAPAIAARLQGALDMVRFDRVGGWALDRSDRTHPVEIEIRREGRPIATVKADRPRKDLGAGNHGFQVSLDPPLEPGFEFTLTAIARAADGTRTPLRRPGPPAAPERRLLERIFEDLADLRVSTSAPDFDEAIRRLDLAQLRIEAALAAIEPPAPAPTAGLRTLVGLALATAIGSLLLGLWSMLAG